MSGYHFNAALEAHRYCMPGFCIALSPIAYELAMYKVNMELMSRVGNGEARMIEVFKVLD